MKYLEAKRLAEQRAREARAENEPKMDAGPPQNKAIIEGPANKDAEEWTMRIPPEHYIAMNADSDNPDVQERVALARRIVSARE